MKPSCAVKIGVLGLGNFGLLHARTLAGLGEFELVAVATRRDAVAEQTARTLGAEYWFTDPAELLGSGCLDAVVIATRTDTHTAYARMALAAGLHVFVEKPVAENAADLRELIGHAGRSDRAVMASHLCLFHSLAGKIYGRVRESGFRTIRFERHRPARLCKIFPEEHPVRIIMVHDLYVAAQAVGGEEPIHFDAWESCNADGFPDLTWARLTWADGRAITFDAHMNLPDGAPQDGWDTVEIFGEGHYLKVPTNPGPAFGYADRAEWPVDLEISEVDGRPVGMLAEALRSFAAACHGRPVPPGCTLADALQVQQWIDTLIAKAGGARC